MAKLHSKFLEQLNLFAEYELVILLFVLILLTTIISKGIKLLLPDFRDTSLSFYLTFVLLIIIVSNVYKISSYGGFAATESKLYLWCSLGVAVIKLFLLLGFRELVTIDLKKDMNYLYKHMDLLFRTSHKEFPYELYLLVLIGIQIPINFSLMPSFVRFASTYVKLKKDIDSHNLLPAAERAAKKGHMAENQSTFRVFQIQIVINLLVLLLFFKPVEIIGLQFNPKYIVYGLVVVYFFACAYTMRFEIQIFLGKPYHYIRMLLDNPSQQNLIIAQRKVNSHLHAVVMVSFHILSKFLIPTLLVALIFIKRTEINTDSMPPPIEYTKVTNDPRIFLSESKCQKLPGIIEISHYGAALSEFSTDNLLDGVKDLVARVNKYGMISNSWIKSIFDFFLFDFFLCNYLLSIIYILFLGKSDFV